MTTEREGVAEVLAAHGPSGFVNSREGWVGCECGERLHLPSGLTFDGYPDMWDEERNARDAHVADAIAPLIAEREEAARSELINLAAGYRERYFEVCGQLRETNDAHDAMGARAEAAEAKVARVEALADEWAATVDRCTERHGTCCSTCTVRWVHARDLRRALAPEEPT